MTKTSESAVKLSVSTLSEYGEGISYWQGYEVYLKGVLPGETVLASIGQPFTQGSKRCPGRVLALLKQSSDRRADYCRYCDRCGGCPLGLMNYNAQLRVKRELVLAALNETGLDAGLLSSYVPSPVETFWRNKTIRYFGTDLNGKLTAGFFSSRSHVLVQIESCAAEPQWFSEVTDAICTLFSSWNFPVHGAGKSGLRALLLRDCDGGRLGLLISSEVLSSAQCSSLRDFASLHKFASFSFMRNSAAGNALLQGETQLLYGEQTVSTVIGPFTYAVGPQTFLQVNRRVTETLYSDAVNWCGNGGKAVDLCCGIGTMTLRLAVNFESVRGLEIVESSCEAARKNALVNSISNTEFVCADIAKDLNKWLDSDVEAVVLTRDSLFFLFVS